MTKFPYKIFIIPLIAIIVLSILLTFIINSGVKEFTKNYEKPDTTIVVHNGKADTTITIKQVPAILK